MRYILHLINVYVIEDVPFCPGLVGTVVKLIQDKILTMQLPADVTLVAFDVLMDFVDLYDFVKRDSKVRNSSIFSNGSFSLLTPYPITERGQRTRVGIESLCGYTDQRRKTSTDIPLDRSSVRLHD